MLVSKTNLSILFMIPIPEPLLILRSTERASYTNFDLELDFFKYDSAIPAVSNRFEQITVIIDNIICLRIIRRSIVPACEPDTEGSRIFCPLDIRMFQIPNMNQFRTRDV